VLHSPTRNGTRLRVLLNNPLEHSMCSSMFCPRTICACLHVTQRDFPVLGVPPLIFIVRLIGPKTPSRVILKRFFGLAVFARIAANDFWIRASTFVKVPHPLSTLGAFVLVHRYFVYSCWLFHYVFFSNRFNLRCSARAAMNACQSCSRSAFFKSKP
jgi:hypothetical protein